MFGGKGFDINSGYQHVVVPHASSPFISIYEQSGNTVSKIANPSSLPGGFCAGADISQDGRYLGVAAAGGTPYVLFYERQGNTFTKLDNPASMPPNYCVGAGWDPTGTYFCATDEVTGANKFNVYKRSGNTMTLVTGITKPTGTTQCRVPVWNPQGNLLAITLYQSPYLAVYWVDRLTDTFTRITTPCDTFPTGVGYGLSFNQAGTSFAVAHTTSPYISIYNITYNTTSTSFAKIANPGSLPSGTSGYACDWNHDGTSLAVSSAGTPFIQVYNRSGDTFTKVAALTALTGGGGYGTRFSANGQYLYCGPYNSPYFEWYSRSGDTFTKRSNPATTPTGNCNGQLAVFPERT
jgi:6-phosphogluconolactonase (cycloisomerase 2 family)